MIFNVIILILSEIKNQFYSNYYNSISYTIYIINWEQSSANPSVVLNWTPKRIDKYK